MVHFSVRLLFQRLRGPPNVAGPGITYPHTLFSRRACHWV